jgi:hypothetical protein
MPGEGERQKKIAADDAPEIGVYDETELRSLAGIAQLVDPTGESFVMGRIHIDEFEAHADTRLHDANNGQCFGGLPLARQSNSGAGIDRKRLASTNEAATHGNIGGNAFSVRASFEINQIDIGRKRKPDSITTVADASFARLVFCESVFHRNDVAQSHSGRHKEILRPEDALTFYYSAANGALAGHLYCCNSRNR